MVRGSRASVSSSYGSSSSVLPLPTTADTIHRDVEGAQAVIDGLAGAGVDFDDVTRVLEEEGVAAFAASHTEVLETIAKRAEEIRAK